LESEIVGFTGKKTGLFILFWLADLPIDPATTRATGKTPVLILYSWLPARVLDFHRGSRDLLIPHEPKWAQNGNKDSVRVYLVFSTVPVTGLIGALLSMNFQIIEIRAYNLKLSVLLGEKPAFLFPFGWQISSQMN